jgi:hypothetical protein
MPKKKKKEINPIMYGQLIFKKGAKTIQQGNKDLLTVLCCWDN